MLLLGLSHNRAADPEKKHALKKGSWPDPGLNPTPEAAPTGSGLALSPHQAENIEGSKDLRGDFVVIAHFLCSINKSEPLAMVQQSKTSPWTVQSKGPQEPWPQSTETHTL